MKTRKVILPAILIAVFLTMAVLTIIPATNYTQTVYADTGETWVLNEFIGLVREPDIVFNVSFESNNSLYTSLTIHSNAIEEDRSIKYDNTEVYIDYEIFWLDQAYRTVTFATAPTGDLLTWLQTYAVKQEPQPTTFTITYETNGGTAVPQLTDVTALPDVLPTTTKTNYIFAGWYMDSTFTTLAVPGATITADTTLYAEWDYITEWSITGINVYGVASLTDLVNEPVQDGFAVPVSTEAIIDYSTNFDLLQTNTDIEESITGRDVVLTLVEFKFQQPTTAKQYITALFNYASGEAEAVNIDFAVYLGNNVNWGQTWGDIEPDLIHIQENTFNTNVSESWQQQFYSMTSTSYNTIVFAFYRPIEEAHKIYFALFELDKAVQYITLDNYQDEIFNSGFEAGIEWANRITDLTYYKWTANDIIDLSTLPADTIHINYYASTTLPELQTITDYQKFDTLHYRTISSDIPGQFNAVLSYQNTTPQASKDVYYQLPYESNIGWISADYQTIYIDAGGEDNTNASLITWLQNNGTLEYDQYFFGYLSGAKYSYNYGYQIGYQAGLEQGIEGMPQIEATKSLIGAVWAILDVPLFGFFRLSWLLILVIISALVMFVLKLIRG